MVTGGVFMCLVWRIYLAHDILAEHFPPIDMTFYSIEQDS